MKFKGITNVDVIALIENASELFRLGKYKSKKFVEQYIGLGLSKVGFYGLVEGSEVTALKDNQTVFDSPKNVNILIEGVVELGKVPVNNGAGNIVYQGYGILEVNGTVIYDGRIGTLTATWGSINGTLSNQTDLQNALDAKVDDTEKGAALGVATLDATGKLPTSQLPISAMEYKGVWNASTNSPALSDGVGTNGDYYLVSADGTTNLDGEASWKIGDAVVFNGTLGVWQKSGKSQSSDLNSLTDVTTGLPVTPTEADDGRLLFYDYDAGEWITDETVTHGTVVINCKKSTAGTIAKGLPVYLVGFDADLHTVELANASSTNTMPVIGFTAEPLNDTDSKHLTTFGKLTGIDTTSTVSTLNPNGETWAVNDALYMSTTAGGLTKVRPTGGTTLIQRIAKVLKVDATGGQIFVFNTARTAGLPNLSTDKLWIGDANGIPQEVDKSTIGGASIYTADDTIGSGRIATLTDTLTFKKQPNINALFIEQEVHSGSDASSLIHMESEMNNSTNQYKFITGQERGTGQNYFEITSKGDVNNSSNLGIGFYYSNAKTQGVNYSYTGIVTTNYAFKILADVGTKNVFNLYSGTNNITGRGYLQFRNYNDTADRIFLTRTGKNFINPDNVFETDAGLVVMGENYIGSEIISLQGRTAVQGADTLSTSTAFEIYDGDTTPTKLWDFRNNGDLLIAGGVSGAFDGRSIKAGANDKIVFDSNGMEIYMSNPVFYCPNNTDNFYFKRADTSATILSITGAGWIGLNGKFSPTAALDMNGGSIAFGYGSTIGNSVDFLEMNSSVGWGLYSTSKPFIVLNSNLSAGGTSGDFFSIKTGGTNQATATEVFKVVDNGDIYTNGTLTLSSGRLQNTIVNPTVQETTSAATFTINGTNENTGVLTAQAVALTVANPTGTIVQGQKLVYRIKDNGTARAITWGANFRAIGVTLPTTTTANKLLYVGCIYNTTDSKWDVVAVNEEA